MRNKDIFVLVEGDDLNTKPIGIQALKADGGKSFIFQDIYNQFKKD